MNPILENALYHTNKCDYVDNPTKWIIVSNSDFEEIKNSIHPEYIPHIPNCLEQMQHGIDFAFWYEEGYIVFEG